MTGDDLRAFRQSLGLSDRGFARALGQSEATDGATVRHWERGRAPVPVLVETLVAIASDVPAVRDWLRERGVR